MYYDDEYELVDLNLRDVSTVNELLLEQIERLTDAYLTLRVDEPFEYVLFDMYDQGLISKVRVCEELNLFAHEFSERAVYYRRIRAEKVV